MTRTFLFIALTLGLAAGAQAQSYRCSNGSTIYYSDRPCAGPPPTKLGSYGGSPSRAPAPAYMPTLPRAGKPQEHIKYLSAECADIAEGIRTAPARGVRGDVIAGLHEEYREKCHLQDEEARHQLQQESGERDSRLRAQRDAVALQRDETQRLGRQCSGMRDVIALKRSREKSLNETEVAALRALEAGYNTRCLGR